MTISQDVVRSVFVAGLRDVHAVEHQALALMNRQVEHLANYPEVEARLRSHIEETHAQIARVDDVLDGLGERASSLKDAGLTISGNLAALAHTVAPDEIIKNSFANFAFENFEAASYTGLITLAEQGNYGNALTALRQSLEEEQAMARFVIESVPKVMHEYLARRSQHETASH
jgi:ferritin-like metal-binding protein YciE